jgi:hypothetical protein
MTRRHGTWPGSWLSRHPPPPARALPDVLPGRQAAALGWHLPSQAPSTCQEAGDRAWPDRARHGGRLRPRAVGPDPVRRSSRRSGGRPGRTSTPPPEYGTRKNVEKRILPTFGDIPLGDLDQAPSAHAAPARMPPGSAAMATTVDATGTVAILHHGDASLLVDLAVKAKDASPFSGSGDAPVSHTSGMGQANSTSRRRRHTSVRTILGWHRTEASARQARRITQNRPG